MITVFDMFLDLVSSVLFQASFSYKTNSQSMKKVYVW